MTNGNFCQLPVPDERLAVSATAVQLATFVPQAEVVLISVEGGGVRTAYDGINPTSTSGHLLPSGYREFWPKETAEAAKFIRQSVDASIHASSFVRKRR